MPDAESLVLGLLFSWHESAQPGVYPHHGVPGYGKRTQPIDHLAMELRNHPRFLVRVPVTVECSGKVFEMEAINISRAGLLLSGPEPLPGNSPLTLRLALTREIELQGFVRHQVSGCGVQFISLPLEEQAKLNAYLNKLATAVARPFTDDSEDGNLVA